MRQRTILIAGIGSRRKADLDTQRLFRTWVELSQDQDLAALLALIQRELGRRGYRVSVEIARGTELRRASA
jgi:uncharacterized lipoprotein YajG